MDVAMLHLQSSSSQDHTSIKTTADQFRLLSGMGTSGGIDGVGGMVR